MNWIHVSKSHRSPIGKWKYTLICGKPIWVLTHRLKKKNSLSIHSFSAKCWPSVRFWTLWGTRVGMDQSRTWSSCSLLWIWGMVGLLVFNDMPSNDCIKKSRSCLHGRWSLQGSIGRQDLSTRRKPVTDILLCTRAYITSSVTVQIQFSFFVNESVWNLWLRHFKCK